MPQRDSLDAVILAGGKSERLNGIVPPYHKPFLVINGRSLLVAAVEDAQTCGADRIVVVATGENALPVTQLVGHIPEVRVVLSAGGPARALLTGLEMCQQQRVLVLMSDNVNKLTDVRVIAQQRYAIGYAQVPWQEAERFTRYDDVERRWVEQPFPTRQNLTAPATETVVVWCGPLVIQRQRGLDVLPGHEKIGPVLGNLAPVFDLIPTKTIDVGVPAIVTALTRE